MFVSAGRDLKFHSLTNPDSPLQYIPNSRSSIERVTWSRDNRFLSFVTTHGLPEIVSLKSPNLIKNVHTILAVEKPSTIAFQRTTKRYLGIGDQLGGVVIYDTRHKMVGKRLRNGISCVCCLDFNSGDRNIAVGCSDGLIEVYDVKDESLCETYEASSTCRPITLKYHPVEDILTAALEDGTITQWDTVTGKIRYSSKVHFAAVTGIVLPENTNLILSVGMDNKFSVQDVSTRQVTFCCNLPYPLTSLDASPNGLIVAMGTECGDIYLYDVRQLMEPLNKLKPHPDCVNSIAFENKLSDVHSIDSSERSFSTLENTTKIKSSIEQVNPLVKRYLEHPEDPLPVKYDVTKYNSKTNFRTNEVIKGDFLQQRQKETNCGKIRPKWERKSIFY